jgi:hypothetical protein
MAAGRAARLVTPIDTENRSSAESKAGLFSSPMDCKLSFKAIEKSQVTTPYDVFISYNTRDRLSVMQIAKKLRQCGIEVWLDAWEIQPGTSLMESIGMGVRQAGLWGSLFEESEPCAAQLRGEHR